LGIQIEEMDVANIINVCDRKCRSVGLSALSSEERTVVLANWANFEVELGGLAAFFHNSTGTHAKEIVDALVELGAMEEAAAINQARELLRTRSLKELSMTGQFERLTDKFLASAPGLFVRLSAFVEVHRGELEATAQQCHAGDARNARA
jgi:hypothetical protein